MPISSEEPAFDTLNARTDLPGGLRSKDLDDVNLSRQHFDVSPERSQESAPTGS
jgi:hypothetical protein